MSVDIASLPKITKPVQVLAITGGKGGVGKTHVAVNVGVCLAKMGKKVYLFDADLGLANVDVVLGLKTTLTINDVLQHRCELEDIIQTGPYDLHVIPGASGVQSIVQMHAHDYVGLISSFNSLAGKLDTLIIDTAAGISDSVVRFAQAANEILVVVCDEPASIMDAYALIKVLHLSYGVDRFRIVVNMSSSLYEAKKLFAKLTNVADKYLNVVLHFLGWIPEDELVRKAIKQQCAVVEAYPSCKASECFFKLAQNISTLPLPKGSSKDVQFFIEQMIRTQIVVQ
ncbi:MAG: MinD/ParA family protein [Candidatus Berkiella sp.]